MFDLKEIVKSVNEMGSALKEVARELKALREEITKHRNRS